MRPSPAALPRNARRSPAWLWWLLAGLAGLCLVLGSAGARSAYAPGIRWLQVGQASDVDAAFERARTENKPVFLYWGAEWCPPCQQVKATVFKRGDFIELSRGFVAVQIDGDAPGAQRLGERFRVRGYPSMVLFDAEARELTRLPGEVDAAVYVNALRSALGGSAARAPTRPIAEVLDAALAGSALPPHEWRQLAWYAWDGEARHLLRSRDKAVVLTTLAQNCPTSLRASATRLAIKAVAAASQRPAAGTPASGAVASAPLPDAEFRYNTGAALLRLLGDGSSAREQMDLVTQDVLPVLTGLTVAGSAERRQLQQAWELGARRLSGDESLPRSDRLAALQVRVDLAGIGRLRGEADVSPELRREIRDLVARFDRETPEAGERQSVIPTGAHLLAEAGLHDESDALLKANLPRVTAPHYLLSQLADNARSRGRHQDALRWSRQAWEAAQGAATRLQWGASYLNELVDQAPDEVDRIEAVAGAVFTELARQPDAYHERNVRALQRIATRLQDWQAGTPAGAERLGRLHAQLQPVCQQQRAASPARRQCEALLRPRP